MEKFQHNQNPILSIKNLRTQFPTRQGLVCAVDGVNLEVNRGESLGVVGESGSGKSVTFLSVMGLIRQPGKIVSGSIIFDGQEIIGLPDADYRQLRGKSIAMTMQDALTALNPALTVGSQIVETILNHDKSFFQSPGSYRRAKEQAIEIMRLVSIPDAHIRFQEYPHQFSGGMRQRIMIATALACRPKLLIADEPTTALDVTIQEQILDLIDGMKKSLGMSVVIISHDIGVVAQNCEKIAIMYAGQVIEIGPSKSVIHKPKHPYTSGLLRSIPNLSKLDQRITPIKGNMPNPINPPGHCRFLERCSLPIESCKSPIKMYHFGNSRSVRCVHNGIGL
ncbi:MAG: ABC transporter ATP-binding protein [SAR324 cluster bacterium]|jgi:oligopeptide/dipeptide ABC transporter ATP-binding protein|nr:ABC transporter ATP-binding protein [SAR324 cluster bacterium]|tara:strand:+ start:925 stop:1932 length:1008 start_codon:yes stop_codon:yes gene_type:complete